MNFDQRLRRDRLRRAAAVCQCGELDGDGVRACAAFGCGDVKPPELTVQIARIDGIGGAICEVIDVGCSLRQPMGRSYGANFFEQRAGVGVHKVKIANAVTVVVTRSQHNHPTILLGFNDGGRTIAVPHGWVSELPLHLAGHGGFAGHAARIGHVNGIKALASLTESADQQRAPVGVGATCGDEGATRIVEVDVEGQRRGIDVVMVGVVRVAKLRQAVDLWCAVGSLEKCARHIGKPLGARTGAGQRAVEGVQHAIVGAEVDHGRAAGPGGLESSVTGVYSVRVAHGGRCDRGYLRIDNVAQQECAAAVGLGAAADG